MGLPAKQPEPHTYQPDPQDLAAVERWVGRLAGDLGPGVPCDRIQRGNWVFPRFRSPPMMTETTECKGCHHLGHRLSSTRGRRVQKPELFL